MGVVGVGVVDHDIVHLEDRLGACRLARVVKVVRDLGLTVDDHRRASQVLEIDVEHAAVPGDLGAVMDEALAVQAVGDAGFLHQAHQPGFQHARADAAQHIVPRLAFQHHGLDAVAVQKLAQQQPGWPAADDDDLCAHVRCLPHDKLTS